MCGIAGYIGNAPVDPGRIEPTLDLMRHRGPDHRDHVIIAGGGVHVALLYTRLSIVDLDARSNQPLTIDGCSLIFNGEIYNYVELRRTLREQGACFETESDTEVLLQAYLAYGTSCVDHFEGMWSFAIYDRREGTLFLSRDRFGEKPLYYMQTPDGMFFGSEIKFIRALSGECLRVNMAQVFRYLVNGYKSLNKSGETFYTNVLEVPYACNATIGRALRPRVTRYWTPRWTPREMTLSEAVEGFRYHLQESIRIRLRADVPLAFCLSGGVDSAAIASIAAKVFGYDVASFSISDDDERYNELDNIRATIADLGCRHSILTIPREDTLARLERLVAHHDAPIYTITDCLLSFLSELIAKHGYRVAVSGTGADELVTGYYDHFNLHLYEMRDRPEFAQRLREWQDGPGRFVRNPHLKNPRLFIEDPGFRGHIYLNSDVFAGFLKADFAEPFGEEHFCDSLLRNRMLNELFHEATPTALHQDDRNSMASSIENRSPYLDSRLFAFAYSIPHEHLIRDGYGKYVLRRAVEGVLNDKVRLDRRKRGFNASFQSLIDVKQPDSRAFLLDDGPVFDYVDRNKIEALLDREDLPNSYSKFLFSFVSTKIFLSQQADNNSSRRLEACTDVNAG